MWLVVLEVWLTLYKAAETVLVPTLLEFLEHQPTRIASEVVSTRGRDDIFVVEYTNGSMGKRARP